MLSINLSAYLIEDFDLELSKSLGAAHDFLGGSALNRLLGEILFKLIPPEPALLIIAALFTMGFKWGSQHHGAILLWLFVVRAETRWDLGVRPVSRRVVDGCACLVCHVERTPGAVFSVANFLFLIEREILNLPQLVLVLLHIRRGLVLRVIIVGGEHALILFLIISGVVIILLVLIDDAHARSVYPHGQFLL